MEVALYRWMVYFIETPIMINGGYPHDFLETYIYIWIDGLYQPSATSNIKDVSPFEIQLTISIVSRSWGPRWGYRFQVKLPRS